MRLSEFAEKRIINLYDGEIMGFVEDSDLVLDADSGQLLALLVPVFHGRRRTGEVTEIPWSALKKTGSQILVVDIETG